MDCRGTLAGCPKIETNMAETELGCREQRWSLKGMAALVTGGTRGIGLVLSSSSSFSLCLLLFKKKEISCINFSFFFCVVKLIIFVFESDMPS